jgi:hypothetical protein
MLAVFDVFEMGMGLEGFSIVVKTRGLLLCSG